MRVSVAIASNLQGREVNLCDFPGQFQLPNRLRFAGRTCQVRAKRAKAGSTPEIRMSRAMWKSLGLEDAQLLHVETDGLVWNVGPVLCLYADQVAAADRPFGEQTRLFEELTTYGHALGVFVVVTGPASRQPKSVRYFSKQEGKWKSLSGVQPEIYFRRSGTFDKKHAKTARVQLQQLERRKMLHTLPRNSSNKWSLYEVLRQNNVLAAHLPATTLCSNGEELYRQVMERKDVYIKPPGGAQGVSIYRLTRVGNRLRATWERRLKSRNTERYSNVFQPETKVVTQWISTKGACSTFWKKTRLRKAIVQDTVQLPTFDGSRCDFRWLVQSSDAPKVIARVARLGQQSGITTNIHTGGAARAAEPVIEQMIGGLNGTRYIEQMDAIAMEVVRTLAQVYGPFAEVGIDLALTQSGDIFIFEINPTPGRRMLRRLSPDIRRLSLESLLEYAIRATGYRM